MKKELFITPSIVTFDSLDELIATVEEARELYRSAIDRYGDALGGILRSPPPGTMSSPIPLLNNEESGGKKGKGGSSGGKMSGGWMEIQELSIALNNPVAFHSQLLFKTPSFLSAFRRGGKEERLLDLLPVFLTFLVLQYSKLDGISGFLGQKKERELAMAPCGS